MHGPVIRGRLVTLRPPLPEEAEVMRAWFADPDITRFLLLLFPPTLAAEKDWIETMGKAQDHVIWAIEHQGRLIGTTGLHHIDWANQRAGTGTVIGDKSAWGKGIASEVMALRTRYAFTQLPLRKLHSSVIDGNAASLRAQHKTGYREVGRYREHEFRDGRWRDEILTEVLKSDWLLANPD
ncbi:MAG: GNAT family N-acetyltransferase [Candidatus Dormibacteraeota bacterium]|nr:GNAT family N-acetyltransferase [Candidatus Dormibacteraeota bacterium]